MGGYESGTRIGGRGAADRRVSPFSKESIRYYALVRRPPPGDEKTPARSGSALGPVGRSPGRAGSRGDVLGRDAHRLRGQPGQLVAVPARGASGGKVSSR